MAEDKQKNLEEAFKQIEKQFGKGSVMKLGDKVYEKWMLSQLALLHLIMH